MMNQKTTFNIVKALLIGCFLQLAVLPVAFGQSKADKIDELVDLYTEYGQFRGGLPGSR